MPFITSHFAVNLGKKKKKTSELSDDANKSSPLMFKNISVPAVSLVLAPHRLPRRSVVLMKKDQ